MTTSSSQLQLTTTLAVQRQDEEDTSQISKQETDSLEKSLNSLDYSLRGSIYNLYSLVRFTVQLRLNSTQNDTYMMFLL